MTSIVVDVGGTNIRVGVFSAEKLIQVSRHQVLSFVLSELVGEDLYQAFLRQLYDILLPYMSAYPQATIGVAFPGPITRNGVVSSAPTLWGNKLQNKPIQADCAKYLGRQVVVLNDVTAAAWRYAQLEVSDFCLFTLSSGVGNKVFRHGQVLLNADGQGGELGHCQVAFDEFALPCDCGGHGHLGALASGRGIEQLCRFMASQTPEDFKQSYLYSLCDGDADNINSHKFVDSLLAGDGFCDAVLTRSQGYLVTAMSHVYHSIGVHRFVLIGGFCLAAGEHYLRSLNQVISKNQWFGLERQQLDSMCVMGKMDDDHSLIGMGYYLTRAAAHD